ncbi:hypothetical protein [Faecalibaculum rodentium]|uniref:hypothetical protein n=1 Tax=Faecalibaculum rodentium TaxID=1702221 RepID=UPI0023F04300|nr:hypothetical protein [Faecalibaculum rodentium]
MIHIGLTQEEKRQHIENVLRVYNGVDRIFVFYGDKEQPDFDFPGIETVYTPWKETEMYRTFYPLLGQPYKGQNIPAITNQSLLIVDEMLMTQNSNDLKYNCTHHYLRVSGRHEVFNRFPFIDDKNDFMILMDFDQPDRYKGRSFEWDMVKGLKGRQYLPELYLQEIAVSDKERKSYETRRDKLLDEAEESGKDPNTVPRNLALEVGKFKKLSMTDDGIFVARNRRIKGNNVYTYADTLPQGSEHVYMLDPTYKRKDLEDFIFRNGIKEITYMKTDLGVDSVYLDDLSDWMDRLEEFYGKTDISK